MDALTWLKVVALAVLALVVVGSVRAQARWRHSSSAAGIARSVVAVAALIAIVWASQVSMSALWAAAVAGGGLVLGYVSGRSSESRTSQGSRRLKARPWPALVAGVGYIVVVASIFFGTAVIVSASLLVAVLGTAMIVGASVSEILGNGSAARPTA